MYRRNLLKKLLLAIPSSIILFKERALGDSKIENNFPTGKIFRHKSGQTLMELPLPSKYNTRLENINLALGGEVEGDYRGFPFSWTGYKACADNPIIAGQWLTYSFTNRKPCFLHKEGLISPYAKVGDPIFIMSSTPGASGQYGKGASFNLITQPWQDTPTLNSSIKSLMMERDKALEILKMEIDAYLDGPHSEVVQTNKLGPITANNARLPFLTRKPISVNQ